MADFIWRMETADGRGAYSYGGLSDYHEYTGFDHPSPESDGLEGFVQGQHYFGFLTLKQAEEWWFNEAACESAASDGNVLVAYAHEDVTDIIAGGRQCVFRKGEAVPVLSMPCDALHKRPHHELHTQAMNALALRQ